MTQTQKEVNQYWHLSALGPHQIADKLNITPEQVLNLIMSWEEFYKKSVGAA